MKSPLFAIALFAALAAAVERPADAAPGKQGIKFQGIKFQGIKFQGALLDAVSLPDAADLTVRLNGFVYDQVQLDGSALALRRFYVGRDGLPRYRMLEGGVLRTGTWVDGAWSENVQRGSLLGATFDVTAIAGGAPVALTARVAGATWDASSNTMAHYADGAYASNSDVALYDLELNLGSATNPVWVPMCDDQAGTGYGVFVDGTWDEVTGAWSSDGLSFACQDVGVVAKCVTQWGYKPWKSLPSPVDGALVSLAPLHRACVRAARADYCADGVSFTEEGTPIDLFDAFGFNLWASWGEMQSFEAHWEAANCPTGADGEVIDCKDFDFALESIIGEDGTVAHHEERYGYQFQLLTCEPTAPASFSYYATDGDMWSFLGDHLYTDLIAVRSDPTYWPFIGPELPEAEYDPDAMPEPYCPPYDPTC